MKAELTPYQQADAILKALLADLRGRAGFDDNWGMADRETQREMRATWRRLILQVLKPPIDKP